MKIGVVISTVVLLLAPFGLPKNVGCRRQAALCRVWDTLIPDGSIKDTVIKINVTKVAAKFWLQFLCLTNG